MAITFPRTWPASIGLKTSRFGLSKNEAAFEGPMARQVNTFSHAAGMTDRWEGVLTTPLLNEANRAVLSAIGVSLGVKNTINLFDPDRREPRSGLKPGGGFTNWILSSTDLQAPAWSGSATLVTNVDGTADSLEDDDSGTVEFYLQDITVPDDTATYTVSLRVKKEGTTIIPGMDVSLSGGTSVIVNARLDAKLGTATSESTVADEGTYWRWSLSIINNLSGNTNLRISILPIIAATLGGGQDATLLGTIIVKEFQIERAASVGTYEATGTGILVKGASQTGKSLATDGLLASSTIMLDGDYFQIGNGFHMSLADIITDGSGNATLDFEPAMRSSPADDAAITVINPVFIARMTSPDFFWDTDERKLGAISFAFEEVV